MKRTLATVFLGCTFSTPSLAIPLYAGIQVDDTSSGALFGYQISNTYAVEVNYSRSYSKVTHAGITVDTDSIGTGIVGIAQFHMKLRNVLPYSLFVKAGYERTSSTETYSIPTSVTLTLPYNGHKNNIKNQVMFGGGAEYDFTMSLSGRMGIDFLGSDKSVNLAVIYKF